MRGIKTLIPNHRSDSSIARGVSLLAHFADRQRILNGRDAINRFRDFSSFADLSAVRHRARQCDCAISSKYMNRARIDSFGFCQCFADRFA